MATYTLSSKLVDLGSVRRMLLLSAFLSGGAALVGLAVMAHIVSHDGLDGLRAGSAPTYARSFTVLGGCFFLLLKAALELRAATKVGRAVLTVPLSALPRAELLTRLAQCWTVIALLLLALGLANVALLVLGLAIVILGLPVSFFTAVKMNSVVALTVASGDRSNSKPTRCNGSRPHPPAWASPSSARPRGRLFPRSARSTSMSAGPRSRRLAREGTPLDATEAEAHRQPVPHARARRSNGVSSA